jgi:hypothetical protein
MLGPGTNAMLRIDTHASVRWTTPEALIDRIEELRGELERHYRALVSSLVVNDLLTSDEAASLSPQIDVQLFDRRTNPDPALPQIRP